MGHFHTYLRRGSPGASVSAPAPQPVLLYDFGNTPSDLYEYIPSNFALASPYPVEANWRVTSFSLLGRFFGTGPQLATACLATGTPTAPGAVLAQSEPFDISAWGATTGWHDLTVPETTIPSGSLVWCWVFDPASSNTIHPAVMSTAEAHTPQRRIATSQNNSSWTTYRTTRTLFVRIYGHLLP